MIAMFLYNLLIFFSVRDRHLYYVFVGTLLAYTLTFNGVSFKYLWPANVWWANVSLSVFVNLLGASFYLFARSFLNTNTTMPLLDRLLLALAGVSVINVLLALTLPPGKADGLATYTSIAGIVVITAVVFVSLKKRVSGARIYLLAWLVYVIGASVAILRALTILPSNFLTHYSIHMGAALQVILFSSGLAERINSARAGGLQALEALAESEEQYRQLIENATEAIFITRDFRVVFANARTFEFVGRRPEELIDVPYLDYIHPDDREVMRDRFLRRIAGEDLPNEHEFRLLIRRFPLMRESAMLVSAGTSSDHKLLNVSPGERNRGNRRLPEKELLLKEIHHRVKQHADTQFTQPQMRTMNDDTVRDILMESQNRYADVAIHEKIYKSENRGDFSDYIGNWRARPPIRGAGLVLLDGRSKSIPRHRHGHPLRAYRKRAPYQLLQARFP